MIKRINLAVSNKTFRLIKRIYNKDVSKHIVELDFYMIINDDYDNKFIGRSYSMERYKLELLELSYF